jgi:hypothetical protein
MSHRSTSSENNISLNFVPKSNTGTNTIYSTDYDGRSSALNDVKVIYTQFTLKKAGTINHLGIGLCHQQKTNYYMLR